jgi:hypothetical protein
MANPFDEFDSPAANPFDEFDGPASTSSLVQAGKNFIGGNDAALAMLGQLPAMAAGGLMGIGSLLTTGDINKAGDTVRHIQESNFGLGAPQPFTQSGKDVQEMVGDVTEKGLGLVGQGVASVAGDTAGNLAQFGTELAVNLAPIPGYKGIQKVARHIEGSRKTPSASSNNAADVIAEEKAKASSPTMKVDINLDEGPNLGGGIEVNSRGEARVDLADRGTTEAITRQRMAERAARADELSQTQLFDQPEMGRVANPYEAATGDWRVDENGMPFKVDLSLEAQNLENPLQRNLWGDEQAMKRTTEGQGLQGESSIPENDIPLTQAVDSMLKGPERDAAIARLQHSVEDVQGSLGELKGAVAEANRQPHVPSGQRGAINPGVFKEGFERLKKLADGTWLKASSDGHVLTIAAIKNDAEVGRVDFIKPAGDEATAKLKSDWTGVKKEERGNGLATEMYTFARDLGNDIKRSTEISEDGRDMWKGFERSGLASRGTIKSPGNRQQGVLWMGTSPTPPKPRPDTVTNPRSPENIADKEGKRRVADRFPGRPEALDEFRNVSTKEEAIALGEKHTKDISKDIGQKQLGSGINFHAAMSNNPVLKFARHTLREARVTAEQLSHKFITQNKTGMSPLWIKMKADERIATWQALMEGDKQQFEINDAVMDKLGFTDTQRQFVKTYYEADKALYARWTDTLNKLGLKVPPRTGHLPGVFTGAYKTLVMAPKLNKDGSPIMKNGKPYLETVSIIAVDTAWQREKAKKFLKKEYPEASFIDKDRSGLSGTSPRYYSDLFSGVNDVLAMLGTQDPRFADVQDLVSKMTSEMNNKLFNFNVHELHKKGISGNDGNRPWLDAKRNTEDGFKSLVRYFEEGFLHHELQLPLDDLRAVSVEPKLSHLPNTLKYLDKYVKKVTGADLDPLGAAVNTALDFPFKMTGIGPAIPLSIAGAIKNNMSHLFMGYGNYMFTAAQLLQPLQTGTPFMQVAANRLGMSQADVMQSMASGGNHFMLAWLEGATGETFSILPDHMRTAYKYARDRGLMQFSELERAYQGTQGTVSRVKDRLAEANMKFGENATRTPMFMALTDLMVRSGLDVQTALPIAEHMAQFAMIDYHAWERPMIYSKMGVLGQFAGGLTTFKHGLESQQVYLGKQAIAPAVGKRQALPIATSVATMIALAGVSGAQFYGEADSIYQYLTNKFGGEARTIRDALLSNLPESVKTGLPSALTGLNIQGKFSSADMVPDSLAKAASPHLEAFTKIIMNAIDMAKSGADPQSVRNFLLSVTPAAWKGITENKVARDEDNYLIGNDGKRAIQRTDEEWKARQATGLRPHREAIERADTWAARQRELKNQERLKEISKEYERRIVNGTLDSKAAARLQQEYLDRKGNISTLIELETSVPVEMQFDQKERLQGIPKSLGGAQRFQNYNR